MAHLDKVIAWKRPDGGVSITHLHSEDMLEGESEDQFIARHTEKLQASPNFDGFIPIVIPNINLPQDSENREEWSIDKDSVIVDPVKLQAKRDKQAKMAGLLSKLGISKDDLKALNDHVSKG